MVATRFQTVGVSVQLRVSDSLSRARRQQLIAAHAREGLAESQAINRAALGRVPPHITFVDGRSTDALETVDPDNGAILFRFQLALEVFEWIEAMLIANSPVGRQPKSPEYAKSHIFFADGVEADPAAPPQADVYVFLSTVPYARKIEGVGGRRGQSDQAPDGVYEAVAAMANRRFGNVVRVRFGFRAVMGGAIPASQSISERRAATGSRRQASADARQSDMSRQPAIIIAMN